MSDTAEARNGSGNVTIRMLMDELTRFRDYFDERFTRLESAISDSYQRKDLCSERFASLVAQMRDLDRRHAEALEAAVEVSRADRQKIWDRVHEVDRAVEDVQAKTAAASMLVAIGSAVVTAIVVRWLTGG